MFLINSQIYFKKNLASLFLSKYLYNNNSQIIKLRKTKIILLKLGKSKSLNIVLKFFSMYVLQRYSRPFYKNFSKKSREKAKLLGFSLFLNNSCKFWLVRKIFKEMPSYTMKNVYSFKIKSNGCQTYQVMVRNNSHFFSDDFVAWDHGTLLTLFLTNNTKVVKTFYFNDLNLYRQLDYFRQYFI